MLSVERRANAELFFEFLPVPVFEPVQARSGCRRGDLGRYMYVAISGSDHTLAVDLRKLAIVAKIKTGARPARISTANRVTRASGSRMSAPPKAGPLAPTA